ncbi:MAG: hypothetical protein HY656_08625 [Acidobacteria bacterium]|nr:hypothetical protein [Acidobacteriota bacterium]
MSSRESGVEGPHPLGSLRAVRSSAWVALGVFAAALIWAGIEAGRRDPCKTVPAVWWVVLGSLLAAQAGILLLLRQNKQRAAAGLAVFGAVPGLVLALAAPATNVINFRTHFASPGVLAPLSLLLFPAELMLLMAGARALVSLGPAGWPSRLRGVLMVAGLLAGGLLIAWLGIRSPGHVFPYRAGGRNESSAVARLRILQTDAEAYVTAYRNGFPPSLAVLTPPPADSPESCEHAGLIDPAVATGVRSGYRFEYRPGPTIEKPGPECAVAGVKSYAVVARPQPYKETGTRSFFSDESGVLRWTCEDRAATAQDPPI